MTVNVIRTLEHNAFGNFYVLEPEYDAVNKVRRHTYCQLEELYDKYPHKLGFSPKTYAHFDDKALDYLRDYPALLEGIYESGAKHYADYEVIRKNMAMVRLALYQQHFSQGFLFNGHMDQQNKQAMLEEIATCMGATLKHEARKRIFLGLFDFSPKSIAEKRFGRFGIEHEGAAQFYKRLLRKQNSLTLNPLRWIQGKFNRYDWNLPPIEETILRSQDINKAVYIDTKKKDIGADAPAKHLAAEAKIAFEACYHNLYSTIGKSHQRPQALPDAEAEESVILAHRIIDNWKLINSDHSQKQIDEVDLKNKELEKGQLLAELAMTYDKLMADIAATSPELLSGPQAQQFTDAKLAMGKLGYLTLVRAIKAATEEKDGNLQHALLYIEETRVPAAYKQDTSKDEAALIAQIEQALKAAEQYRAAKKNRKPVSPDLNVDLTKTIANMHGRINGDSANIGAANSWAIPEAKALNTELSQKEAKVVQMTPDSTASQYRA